MAAWDVLNELRVYRPARIFELLDPKVYVVQPQPDLLRYEARISEAKVPQFTSPKVIQSTIELGIFSF